jgi:CspA family cold shock protein
MNDMLTRAACDFEDDTRRRQNIAKDVENEIAIAYCRRRALAVIGHFARTFNLAFAQVRWPIRRERIMAAGTVKWFNATKGFGFIQPDAGGTDVFVHISAVERADMRDLNEGQKIVYEVVADRRTGKSSADNLKPA